MGKKKCNHLKASAVIVDITRVPRPLAQYMGTHSINTPSFAASEYLPLCRCADDKVIIASASSDLLSFPASLVYVLSNSTACGSRFRRRSIRRSYFDRQLVLRALSECVLINFWPWFDGITENRCT